ncbi:NAD/NADP transhydrogenase alpha subunit [Ammoniphilus oxalaticus]|uniref:NAD/NADP transhydrogenase alpha subunit n=1 Tax=Ammoniphilus oxalaticus TaxID=66863 RepID=A0A419SKV8_9BACL|nr:NAD/NADP transhydrogenase alpha subunit [Ammoniphilus oxalaticus]RKD24643.1 NAD/NADP transhydrogenase alpha subunit [Ammoniphilus oxalaticus]
MRCISVYTKDFGVFSDVYEQILALNLAEDEEAEVDGITVSDAGKVDEGYIENMRQKPEVAVLRVKKHDATILQHGDVFEILLPSPAGSEEAETSEETETA